MFLEIKDVRKEIGPDCVLQDINISMEKGRIYGLQGKNGCGKSMLMRVICGLVLPTEGQVVINGERLGKEISFPRSIGMMIESPGFLDSYSGYQNLKMLASIKNEVGDKEILDALQRVGLEEDMNKKYRKYSLGMKQKLGIAAAIFEKPDIVILDEPANALDEKSEQKLWEILKEEKMRGALVIISCHVAENLETVSDEIFSLDRGKVTDHYVIQNYK